jgi:6-phosphofructo-2-kinase / fructose-2,6-biphosphatase 3
MHLTRESRSLVGNYCRESVFHNLIVEFDCDEKCLEDNIKDTAMFYQKNDSNQDWLKLFNEKSEKFKGKYEKCSPLEGPLISVNNSENQMIHSVTARRVQGLLQTIILGVLSSPVIKHRVFFFSRVKLNLIGFAIALFSNGNILF